MKNKLLPTLIACLLSFACFSQSPFAYKGFSGGMMMHSGYLQSNNFNLIDSKGNILPSVKAKGLPFGLGGLARVHFGNHLRIGGEGYVSHLTYGEYNSICSISWGGILIDFAYPTKHFTPFAGTLIGGGNYQNITHSSLPQNDFITEENTSFRQSTFFALCPFVGIDYSLNSKLHLILKADYLINISNPSDDFTKGVRLFFGIVFYSIKTE